MTPPMNRLSHHWFQLDWKHRSEEKDPVSGDGYLTSAMLILTLLQTCLTVDAE